MPTTLTVHVPTADFPAYRRRVLTNQRVIVLSSPVAGGYRVTTRKASKTAAQVGGTLTERLARAGVLSR